MECNNGKKGKIFGTICWALFGAAFLFAGGAYAWSSYLGKTLAAEVIVNDRKNTEAHTAITKDFNDKFDKYLIPMFNDIGAIKAKLDIK